MEEEMEEEYIIQIPGPEATRPIQSYINPEIPERIGNEDDEERTRLLRESEREHIIYNP